MALPIRRRGSSPGAVLRRLDPFADFESMWDQMGRFLEQAATPAAVSGAWLPMAEEEEGDNSYTVKLELPGFPAENIDIEVEGDELVVSGELSEEHQGKVLTRRQGSFMYRTSLPAGADAGRCDASLDNGVLTVTVPKTAQQQRRKIEIGKGHRTLEGKTPSELAGEGESTTATAQNTYGAGSTASSATGTQSGGGPPAGAAPTGAQP